MKKRIRASSLLESVTAILIIAIVIALSAEVFGRVYNAQSDFAQIKAKQTLDSLIFVDYSEPNLENDEFERYHYNIVRLVEQDVKNNQQVITYKIERQNKPILKRKVLKNIE